jgi:DNA recombination protein RmuC
MIWPVILLSALTLVALVILIIVMLAGRRPAGSDPALGLMQQQVEGLRQQVSESLTSTTSLLTQQMGEMNRQLTQQTSEANRQVMQLMGETTRQVVRQMADVTGQVNQQLGSITQQFQGTTASISQRLDKAAEVIGGVQKGLGELSGSTQRILDVGKDIAQLQQILRSPKLRGGLGELLLTDLIAQILPRENYDLQYRFKSGEAVDAVIRLGRGMVPVDAKFPLENFRKLQTAQSDEERTSCRKAFVRDVKKHIDDVGRKYILPDEGTFDFALVYIPAENVYYETIIKDESSESESIAGYALKKKVIPVSPNSFYAYLQAITVGLRGLQIEKQAQHIMAFLERLNADFGRFRDDFSMLGKHLANARNKYEDSEKRLVRFEDKLSSARSGSAEDTLEPPEPPAPQSPQLPLDCG